jgi:cell shape-determining protein MreD
MNFLKTKTDAQLRKWNRICMVIAIGILVIMMVFVALSLFQVSEQNENAWLSGLGPSLLLPLIFIPLLISSGIQKELEKRNKSDS